MTLKTKCKCGHEMGVHAHRDREEDAGPCYSITDCGCREFRAAESLPAEPEQGMTDAELDAELRANGIDPHELNVKMLNRIREEKAAGKSGPLKLAHWKRGKKKVGGKG